jgi:MarR family transcriptional regulator, lower aerobic nicotinate degradation pathway regulator
LDVKSKSGTRSSGHDRGSWLRALMTPEHPGHVSPTLVIYRLLKLSSIISGPYIQRDATRYGISLNELRVLMTLAPLREAASHEIAQVAGMNQMSVSRAVAALRAHKRVRQRTDPNNRRRRLLQLTEEGWALHRKAIPQVEKMASLLLGDLTQEEIGQLSRFIDVMAARLESANAESDVQQ